MEITFWQDNKNSRATCIERLWDCPSAGKVRADEMTKQT
jgi:hypothetical protein